METTNEIMTQETTEAVEVVANTSNGAKVAVATLALTGLVAAGYGIYKGFKFVKGKIAEKKYAELSDYEEDCDDLEEE